MEDARGQDRIGTGVHGRGEVLGRSSATGGDHRDGDGVGVTVGVAVAVGVGEGVCVAGGSTVAVGGSWAKVADAAPKLRLKASKIEVARTMSSGRFVQLQ